MGKRSGNCKGNDRISLTVNPCISSVEVIAVNQLDVVFSRSVKQLNFIARTLHGLLFDKIFFIQARILDSLYLDYFSACTFLLEQLTRQAIFRREQFKLYKFDTLIFVLREPVSWERDTCTCTIAIKQYLFSYLSKKIQNNCSYKRFGVLYKVWVGGKEKHFANSFKLSNQTACVSAIVNINLCLFDPFTLNKQNRNKMSCTMAQNDVQLLFLTTKHHFDVKHGASA